MEKNLIKNIDTYIFLYISLKHFAIHLKQFKATPLQFLKVALYPSPKNPNQTGSQRGHQLQSPVKQCLQSRGVASWPSEGDAAVSHECSLLCARVKLRYSSHHWPEDD